MAGEEETAPLFSELNMGDWCLSQGKGRNEGRYFLNHKKVRGKRMVTQIGDPSNLKMAPTNAGRFKFSTKYPTSADFLVELHADGDRATARAINRFRAEQAVANGEVPAGTSVEEVLNSDKLKSALWTPDGTDKLLMSVNVTIGSTKMVAGESENTRFIRGKIKKKADEIDQYEIEQYAGDHTLLHVRDAKMFIIGTLSASNSTTPGNLNTPRLYAKAIIVIARKKEADEARVNGGGNQSPILNLGGYTVDLAPELRDNAKVLDLIGANLDDTTGRNWTLLGDHDPTQWELVDKTSHPTNPGYFVNTAPGRFGRIRAQLGTMADDGALCPVVLTEANAYIPKNSDGTPKINPKTKAPFCAEDAQSWSMQVSVPDGRVADVNAGVAINNWTAEQAVGKMNTRFFKTVADITEGGRSTFRSFYDTSYGTPCVTLNVGIPESKRPTLFLRGERDHTSRTVRLFPTDAKITKLYNAPCIVAGTISPPAFEEMKTRCGTYYAEVVIVFATEEEVAAGRSASMGGAAVAPPTIFGASGGAGGALGGAIKDDADDSSDSESEGEGGAGADPFSQNAGTMGDSDDDMDAEAGAGAGAGAGEVEPAAAATAEPEAAAATAEPEPAAELEEPETTEVKTSKRGRDGKKKDKKSRKARSPSVSSGSSGSDSDSGSSSGSGSSSDSDSGSESDVSASPPRSSRHKGSSSKKKPATPPPAPEPEEHKTRSRRGKSSSKAEGGAGGSSSSSKRSKKDKGKDTKRSKRPRKGD